MNLRDVSLLLLTLCTVVPVATCGLADEPPRAGASKPDERWPVGRTIFAETALEKRVRAALAEPLTHEFKDVSLDDVAKFLQPKLKCAVIVDEPALAASEIKPDLKLSHRARGGSLKDELRRMFATASYWAKDRPTFLLRDECLWITTTDAAESRTELRVYQVHDLVVDASDLTISSPRLDALRQLVIRCCGEGWSDHNGHYGKIKSFEGAGILALAVVQTDEGHEAIERLLAQLRAAKVDEPGAAQREPKAELLRNEQVGVAKPPPLPPPPRMPRGKVIDQARTVAERKIHETLRKPAMIDFVDKPLGEIAAELTRRFGIEVRLDTFSLTADGKSEESRLTWHWPDGELRHALDLMLGQHGLTYLVRDDALVVTTRTAAEVVSRTVVYQVHDLIAQDWSLIGRLTYFEAFEEIITGLLSPETWRDDESYVTGFETAGIQVLVIENGDRYHPEIETFLDLLRDAYEPKVYEAQRRRPVIKPKADADGHPGTRGMGAGF